MKALAPNLILQENLTAEMKFQELFIVVNTCVDGGWGKGSACQ